MMNEICLFNIISRIMKEKKFIPNSIDTSDVRLPKELETLIEKMSKNVHEV